MSRGSMTEEDVRQATALVESVVAVDWGEYVAAAGLYLDPQTFEAVLKIMNSISDEWGILSDDDKT